MFLLLLLKTTRTDIGITKNQNQYTVSIFQIRTPCLTAIPHWSSQGPQRGQARTPGSTLGARLDLVLSQLSLPPTGVRSVPCT